METLQEQEIRTTNVYPVVPLRGKVAFPKNTLTFEVGRQTTVKAVEQASATHKHFLVLTQRDTEKTDITADDLYTVGSVAKIKQISQLPSGVMRVACEVLYRAKARVISLVGGCFTAVCDPLPSIRGEEVMETAHLRTAKALAREALSLDGKTVKELLPKWELCEDADDYVNALLPNMRIRLDIKQQALEERRVVERILLLEKCLNDELEISKIEKKLANAVRQSIDKNQK